MEYSNHPPSYKDNNEFESILWVYIQVLSTMVHHPNTKVLYSQCHLHHQCQLQYQYQMNPSFGRILLRRYFPEPAFEKPS